MKRNLEPADMDEWTEEFFLGMFSWFIIPMYFGFVTIVGLGIATKFVMGKTGEFMRERFKSL